MAQYPPAQGQYGGFPTQTQGSVGQFGVVSNPMSRILSPLPLNPQGLRHLQPATGQLPVLQQPFSRHQPITGQMLAPRISLQNGQNIPIIRGNSSVGYLGIQGLQFFEDNMGRTNTKNPLSPQQQQQLQQLLLQQQQHEEQERELREQEQREREREKREQEQQQREREHQLREREQQLQEQLLREQQLREKEQYQLEREQQLLEKEQQLREQQLQELQEREQQQREREQREREQREEQQRKREQREQAQRERKEQQEREQREKREQREQREREKREQRAQREREKLEQRQRELQEREQQLREQQQLSSGNQISTIEFVERGKPIFQPATAAMAPETFRKQYILGSFAICGLCFVFGIFAYRYAQLARKTAVSDPDHARRHGRTSLTLSIVGITFNCIVILGIVAAVVVCYFVFSKGTESQQIDSVLWTLQPDSLSNNFTFRASPVTTAAISGRSMLG